MTAPPLLATMTSLRVSSKHEPLPSVSEPPSPIEEDLAKAAAWDDDATSTLVSSSWKGKGKQRDDDVEEEDDISRDTETGQYPPMAEEDLEARKVEENLKRWETLEKQRRKKARDSLKHDSLMSNSSSSFVEDVSRRTSKLWNKARPPERDAAVRPRARTSGHAVLENIDDPPPATPSSRASTAGNPFESPEDRDAQPGPFMIPAGPGSLPPTPRVPLKSRYPTLQVQPAQVAPPQPLGLPDPEEEARRRQQVQMEEEIVKEKRWWTEWLCGCREHGEFQAGRTNPME